MTSEAFCGEGPRAENSGAAGAAEGVTSSVGAGSLA